MNIHEIVEYLEDEMPDRLEPEQLATFILTILHGYLEKPEIVVAFLRAVVNTMEKNMDAIKEHMDDVADES